MKVLAFGLVFFLPAAVFAGMGAIEFTVTPLKENPSDYKHEMLFQGGSSDGSEYYEFQVVGSDLLVLRDFGQCVRSANRSLHDFRRGERYRIALSWNGPSTRLSINGREIKGFNLLARSDARKYAAGMKAGNTDAFAVTNVAVFPRSDLAVDPADSQAAGDCHCPRLDKLLDMRPEEEYRGVGLHHFPDQVSLDRVKSFIDLLPVAMAGYLKHVIFVSEAEKMSGAQGLTVSRDTFYLKTGFEPSTFFHEAAHIADMRANWTLSGKWAGLFMKTARPERNSSVLGNYDGSTAPEQLADFTGRAYGFYLKKGPKNFIDWFGAEGRAELDFLLANGLVTGTVYDSLIRR